MNVVGDQRLLVSIALHKEAKATLVRTKQGSMLLPNACIKGAIKQKVLIFDSVPVTMATDALTCEWLLMLGTQSSRHMPHTYQASLMAC